mmetsp:Transcript_29428/g.99138  ORF Transcript_29428/g.99138 Transcript_29428/m.99138 type:complete len:172 (+) Transcript_29428:80-595(+)
MGCSGSKDGVAAPGGVAARDDGADSGGRDKGNEDKVEVAMKMKRRYQNVFSDSVDVSAAPIAVTAAMSKTPAQTALITEALQHNFVFEALGEAETAKIVEFMALRAVPAGTARSAMNSTILAVSASPRASKTKLCCKASVMSAVCAGVLLIAAVTAIGAAETSTESEKTFW